MTEQTAAPENPQAAAPQAAPNPKATRGPTRSAVKFADLVEDLTESPITRQTLMGDLTAGVTAKAMKADVKERRAAVKKLIETLDAEIAVMEERAALLARVEDLKAEHHRALIAMYAHEPAKS